MAVVCPVCRSTFQQSLIGSQDVPVMMHRLYATAEQARRAPLAKLDLIRCRSCGFVWNSAFNSAVVQYDESYENNQGYSKVFREHMLSRADAVMQTVPTGQPLDYLEVGCGQGTFLADVAERAGARLRSADGFDPAYRGPPTVGASIRFHTSYFDQQSSSLLRVRPNVVVSRHTIEHVPDPVEFLRAIRDGLGEDSEAAICIETPDVDWIIANSAIQDFFYEHCSIFTGPALAFALRRAGFRTPKIEKFFGGQYLWVSAHAGAVDDIGMDHRLDEVRSPTDSFIERWRDRVKSASANGRVALWGAGAKGVTFALLADAAGQLVDHVIDINPEKQGSFLPVSAAPIVSPETASSLNATTIFVMNPIYLREIVEMAAAAGISAEFVPIN
jgi:SAM-dependent methyltransferase